MNAENRVTDLAHLLTRRKAGVRRSALEQRWTCSGVTVHRVVNKARSLLGLPIRFDRSKGVYFCDTDRAVDLPGLWFAPEELIGLLGLSHWLDNLGSGVFREMLYPLRTRLEAMLEEHGISITTWHERIRFLPMGSRPVPSELLLPVARAVLDRKRLTFSYQGVHDKTRVERQVSPQTLVRYRDNWLLDAYCHTHQGLRSFALSRIKDLSLSHAASQDIPKSELESHFSEAYGIFGGRAKFKAVLIFEGLAARLVEHDTWHPGQKIRQLSDGKVRLEFPCADLRELVRDLMRYADEVTVEKPESLRKALADMVSRAARRV